MPKAPRRPTGDKPDMPSLPPERDPLAGLENHPLFRVPGAGAAEAHLQALRLAYAQLRRAEAEIEELRRQLEATEAAKRRLLRQLEAVESELAAWKARSASAAVGETGEPAVEKQSYRFEALFTGELPSSKMTLNDIPVELKAFLTATKAALQAEAGMTVTERDQVICSLAAYRLIIDALAPAPHVWRKLAPKDRSRFAARYFGYILERLASLLARASKL
ncbi:MAG: hypothetical protein IMX00_01285 [Limnochordales bacterium]|nr:hypothetical protein [Limnochordales bacterium]